MKADYYSFWEKQAFFEDIDLLIVGSGIVGLSSAYFIKTRFPHWKIIVVESGVLPHGATTRNAGFSCFGSLSELVADLKNYGEDEMLGLVKKRWDGLKLLQKLHPAESIDYHCFGGYELFTNEDRELWEDVIPYMEKINQLLKRELGTGDNIFNVSDSSVVESLGLNNVDKLIFNPYEGQLDSGKLMQSLYTLCFRNGIFILNSLGVESFELKNDFIQILTKNLEFTSKKILISTNGFAKNLIPELKVNPARGQVLVTSTIQDLKLKGTFHHKNGFNYFRNIGNRVLIGGGRHLNITGEETTNMDLTHEITDYLKNLLSEVILKDVNYKIDYAWSGIMGVGEEKSPIIRKIDNNCWCAVRMGGMGVAIGTSIGKEVSELID